MLLAQLSLFPMWMDCARSFCQCKYFIKCIKCVSSMMDNGNKKVGDFWWPVFVNERYVLVYSNPYHSFASCICLKQLDGELIRARVTHTSTARKSVIIQRVHAKKGVPCVQAREWSWVGVLICGRCLVFLGIAWPLCRSWRAWYRLAFGFYWWCIDIGRILRVNWRILMIWSCAALIQLLVSDCWCEWIGSIMEKTRSVTKRIMFCKWS